MAPIVAHMTEKLRSEKNNPPDQNQSPSFLSFRNEKNEEIIDAYCENLDSSGDKFWTHLNRNSSQIEANLSQA